MLNIATKETRLFKEGQREGLVKLVARLLTKRFGNLSESMLDDIKALPTSRLEELGESFLDFSSLADVKTWLDRETSDAKNGK